MESRYVPTMVRVAGVLAVRASAAIAVLAAFPCVSCDPCETGACDAAQTPRSHSKISQGVTGVIAIRSDNCENGCCACSYSDAELRLVEAAEPVTRQNAASIAAEGKSSKTIHARHDYVQALDPGDYLLCEGGGK